MTDVASLFARAVEQHRAGRLADAETLYKQVLASRSSHADALHLLGLVEHQTGRHAQAIEDIRKAIAVNPNAAGYHTNLGSVYAALQQYDSAASAFRAAIALDPRSPESHNNLGNVLKEQGDLDGAMDAYRQAISLRPTYADAFYNLGVALQEAGRIDQAIQNYQHALQLRPAYAGALNNLGNALRDRGRFEEAVSAFRRAVALKPDFADAWSNLGNALHDLGHTQPGVEALQHAAALRPDSAEIHSNLANLLRHQDRLDDAISHLHQALAIRPEFPEALSTLGGVLKDSGRVEEALEYIRKSLSIKPSVQIGDNYLFTLLHAPDVDARQIQEAHAAWNRQFARPLSVHIRPHDNDRTPDRRLRIGYVSPDLSDHPVGRFLVPILEQHNRERFEVFCYTDTPRPDAVTQTIRSNTDTWRPTLGQSDEEVAALVRQDRIDILIDLAMHTRHNRLLVFARKPAPVQVTYLAYSGTTGLETMDYRLTDVYLDPPGSDESVYSEKTVRLPRSFWCYQAPIYAPDVASAPVKSSGFITFGSFNQFAKVSPTALDTWARILRQTPGSRIVIYAAEGSHRRRAEDIFISQGIDASRIAFVGRVNTAEYFSAYSRIDIALDTFPYPGGTTTCDALWMGVPVVCLPGNTAISRGGLSVLSNVGLPEFAATDVHKYIQTAVSLARDLPRLGDLRSSMRQRMLRSPLMDAARFTQDFENVLKSMWREWCASPRK